MFKKDDLKWTDLRDKFNEYGGDGIYTWKLTYQEPLFENLNLLGEKILYKDNLKNYRLGCCPVGEYIQSRLFQFKTNYWDLSKAYEQSEILRKTLEFYS